MLQANELQNIKQRFGIIGNNADLNHAIQVAVQVANTDLSVLITGESGAGKENFPKIIHQNSTRKHEKYIAVNCGAIPEGTIDSELFGHEKGSFTGALNDRKGYFEVADGGTIFLDEVGELPLSTQARLLRVLEVGEFIKVGSSKVNKTNVRVVAATNVNILQAIKNGKFREDLYYRLNAIHIEVPPLRSRKEDIVPLFTKFANDFAEKYHRPAIKLLPETHKALSNYYWQGNVRQLKNVAEQISAVETNLDITLATLKRYLPNEDQSHLPQIVQSQNDGSKTFGSEREILYTVLFDMKKNMDDMRKDLEELKKTANASSHPATAVSSTEIVQSNNNFLSLNNSTDDFEEVQEYSEPTTSLSVAGMEKELIIKALQKHGGKKKLAAMDLKMSERTLYRKLKEYGLEG